MCKRQLILPCHATLIWPLGQYLPRGREWLDDFGRQVARVAVLVSPGGIFDLIFWALTGQQTVTTPSSVSEDEYWSCQIDYRPHERHNSP
ncbi:hypothetical protein LIA77_08430 [Sarocladium implicatum]|nr:hypothetical protein LIA77_08430 [Sarocladium implicatum]